MNSVLLNNIVSKIQRIVKKGFWSEPDTTKRKTVLRVDREKVEHVQDWGFISVPPNRKGEALVLYPYAGDTKGVCIRADVPSLRPEGFLPGDVGLFNEAGVVIKLSGTAVTISGATSIDLGEVTKKLVTEDIITSFNSHKHTAPSGATTPPITPVGVDVLTTKTGAE